MAAPVLLSSSPVDRATGLSQTAAVSFVISTPSAALDPAQLKVYLDGELAISAGSFQAGYTGTVNVTTPSTTVTFTTHPAFTQTIVDVATDCKDLSANRGYFSFRFGVVVPTLTGLSARSYPEGKRIDLLFTAPAGATRVRIRRSQFAFCKFVNDPGDDIYEGIPVALFVDGKNAPIGVPTTDEDLEENKFYYYTVFVSFSGGAPYRWLFVEAATVSGLSIRDYYAEEGDYFYDLLPRTYRERDEDPDRGTDQYLLKRYCTVMQAGVNLYRGWMEGALKIRDVEEMPAGRFGEAANQTGALGAVNWELGVPVERSFDAGVLRRAAIGLFPINRQKGSCTGLVGLVKLYTGWDNRCDEAIEPRCGVAQLFHTWDAESVINVSRLGASVAGSATFPAASTFAGDGTTVTALPTILPKPEFVIDGLGTFACINSVALNAGTYTLTFEDAAAKLRPEIKIITLTSPGAGLAAFTRDNIDPTTNPWQFPSAASVNRPHFGLNAFAGRKLMDSTGTVFPIVSSTDSTSNTVTLTVTGGTPAAGAASIAADFGVGGGTYATRDPILTAKIYSGEFSLTYDPIWDIRLLDELAYGPWTLITALNSLNTYGFAPSAGDVTVWLENAAEQVPAKNRVVLGAQLQGPLSIGWPTNYWAGSYLLPNWNQTKLFRIVANDTDTLLVDLEGGGGMELLSKTGDRFVILSEQSALKYTRLVGLLKSYVPVGSRPYVKFE